MSTMQDKIELILPLKSDYVSLARLAVSGIANRIGFDIEIIEDIKVAVAEVCNKLVYAGSDDSDKYRIVFLITPASLEIAFYSEDEALKNAFDNEENELGISIINAFMDCVVFNPSNSCIVSMTKAFEGIDGDGE